MGVSFQNNSTSSMTFWERWKTHLCESFRFNGLKMLLCLNCSIVLESTFNFKDCKKKEIDLENVLSEEHIFQWILLYRYPLSLTGIVPLHSIARNWPCHWVFSYSSFSLHKGSFQLLVCSIIVGRDSEVWEYVQFSDYPTLSRYALHI